MKASQELSKSSLQCRPSARTDGRGGHEGPHVHLRHTSAGGRSAASACLFSTEPDSQKLEALP